MEQEDKEIKKAKRKSLIIKIVVLLIMIAISVGTSSMNVTQMGRNFFLSIFQFANGNSETSESSDTRIIVKGKHVVIRANEIYRQRQISEILGKDNSKDQAIAELKRVKTLAYYGEKSGYAVTGSELEDYMNQLKEQLKDSNAYKYKAMIKEAGSEKDYWKIVKDSMKETLLSERTLEENKSDLSEQDTITDIDTKLNEYTDELVENEAFKILSK